MADVAHKRLRDAAHLRQQAVAMVSEFSEGQFDPTPLVAFRSPESMLVVGTEGEPERVPAGALPDFDQYVCKPCPAGCPESVKAVRHDEIAIVLEDDDRRKHVLTYHRFGILRHDAIVNVSTSLRPGIEAD